MDKVPASPRNAAMNLLARREHSRAELMHKLQRRFTRDAVEEAVAQLTEENLQSDQRFALSFTRERLMRGYGPVRIAAELRQRGVANGLIDAAIAQVPEEESTTWADVAAAALRKKFGNDAAADFQEKARRARFLNYRGFSDEGACS